MLLCTVQYALLSTYKKIIIVFSQQSLKLHTGTNFSNLDNYTSQEVRETEGKQLCNFKDMSGEDLKQ